MTLQTIPRTLSYYLTENGSGLEEFKNWFNNNKMLDSIAYNISICCIKLEHSKWLQKDIRKIIFQDIKNILSAYVKKICGKEPNDYIQEYILQIDKFCFQGGYGYQVLYNTNTTTDKQCPHHWMIKPEEYKNIQLIQDIYNLELINLCLIICDLYIIIDDKPTQANWN